MVDVSTRSQVEATRPPKAAKAKTTRAAAPGNVDWTDMLPIVCERAATMLRVVAERLENDWDAQSGHRLSALAARTLDTVVNSDMSTNLDALDNHLYDVCALITSAKGTEGENIGSDLAALLCYALETVSALIAVRSSDALPGDVDLMHKLLREPMPDLPAAEPKKGTEFDPWHGPTLEQAKTILEVVTGRTRTMLQLLMMVQGSDDDFQSAVNLDAAVVIATGIGALTDSALGGAIIGSADHWNYGPNFADARKAVQA